MIEGRLLDFDAHAPAMNTVQAIFKTNTLCWTHFFYIISYFWLDTMPASQNLMPRKGGPGLSKLIYQQSDRFVTISLDTGPYTGRSRVSNYEATRLSWRSSSNVQHVIGEYLTVATPHPSSGMQNHGLAIIVLVYCTLHNIELTVDRPRFARTSPSLPPRDSRALFLRFSFLVME